LAQKPKKGVANELATRQRSAAKSSKLERVSMRGYSVAILSMMLAGVGTSANAQAPDQGKFLLTAGFSTIEGTGGGALTPWALIGGYGTSDSLGANVYATVVPLTDFRLLSFGGAFGFRDRVELSVARQQLDATGGSLDGLSVSQDIVGVKVRLFGDAVYRQDSWVPQVAAGAQWKRNRGIDDAADAGLPGLTSVRDLGAADTRSVDYYVNATKLYLAQSILVNATLRFTEANQTGLLGFAGDRNDGYSARGELTLAYLLSRRWAVGAEYRGRPRNLAVDDEQAAWDAFIAWAPTKFVSVVAAYVNLGEVLGPNTGDTGDQNGGYLSLQVGF
jgi:hypothetical protein